MGNEGRCKRSEFPLSVKNVRKIDLEALRNLECLHPDCDLFFQESSRWLDDLSVYPDLPQRCTLKKTFFTQDQVRMMTPTKVSIFSGKPRMSVRGFPVVEKAKGKSRPILAPAVNDIITPLYLKKFKQIPKEVVREQVLLADSCIQLDQTGCYDQYPLSEEVRAVFCFLDEIGVVYAQTCLGMGFRAACQIAQSGTWKLLDFDRKCYVASWIDNFRFLGMNVETDVLAFLKRAQRVGFQFNEIDLYNPDGSPREIDISELEKLKESAGDFLGEHYDYVKKTRCNTKKTVEKVKYVWDKKNEWSARDFAVAIGVLSYASTVADIKPTQFYFSLRLYAHVARICQAVPECWDRPFVSLMAIPAKLWIEMDKWVCIVLKNEPVPVVTKEGSPDLVLIVDASAWGWGAISVDVKTGSVEYVAMKGAS
jgi:hypothetical protein